ncbi:ankyrin repeat domain-containing protein [Hymenobacter sp. ASUV-10]|uniref:Ankyrin repeat domain-containing protein n=1 Tax=Hymenobacter aranciens TaxID=3063996 RepID=A0ABT9B6F0_9BACT|nr:ankyrin repeat domain-containing protein [Hymenobacter sp. ASUV-10]MDO7873768.1 ankyrin repeat domain-containing protein [Hymenobacter sp. ASUV-10]
MHRYLLALLLGCPLLAPAQLSISLTDARRLTQGQSGEDTYPRRATERYVGPERALARAVQQQRTGAIRRLLRQHPSWADTRDSVEGQPLLSWAIINRKRRATAALLAGGANPNIHETFSGRTPLIEAAEDLHRSDYFVELLLAHGADPSLAARLVPNRTGSPTPLIAAIWAERPQTVDQLLAAGADVQYRSAYGSSALQEALLGRDPVLVLRLLTHYPFDLQQPVSYDITPRPQHIAEYLRDWRFPLDSEAYRLKMELVAYLQSKGIDYWQAPIPERFRQLHPAEYLQKY